MKPVSKKKRSRINQEADDYSFDVSSLKEAIEDCTGKKTSSKTNLLDLSSLSQALSSVKRKMNRKERFRRRRRERAVAKVASEAKLVTDAALLQLSRLAKVECEKLVRDLHLHSNKPTRACTEPQLCILNQEVDILDFLG